MSQRPYRQTRRAEAADETRRRIVRATFDLHAEQGIAATTMKQIAERAGVGVGSVYNHMGGYEGAVRACGEYTAREYPGPDATCFENEEEPAARITLLARALFEHYEKLPVLDRVRVEQDLPATVHRFVEYQDRTRAELVKKALKLRRVSDPRVRIASALLDVGTYRSLRRAGLGTGRAAGEISKVINHAAADPPSGRR